MSKSKLRKKILKIREIRNSKDVKIPFSDIFELLKKKNLLKKSIGGYFPVNFEVDDIKILQELKKRNFKISLPVIKKNFDMDFYLWNFNEPLIINKFGIPEPSLKNLIYPDIILIPMVAFDIKLNRLGYGGGYYDRFIEKIDKKKFVTKIGLALSFQKINKVPITKYDKKLDHIITDQYIL